MSQEGSKRIIKTFSALTLVIIFAKLMGFVKQMVIAGNFGATIETDLIQLSQGLIGNADYVIVQTLSTAFVALYIHTNKTSTEKAKNFAANVVKALLVIVCGVAIVMAVASPVISKIIAPSYETQLSHKLARYVLIFSPTIILYVLTALFISILNANKRFVLGEMHGLVQSVVLIITILLLKNSFQVNTLVIGYFAYSLIIPTYLGLFSIKYIGRTRGNPFKDSQVREFLKMCAPLLLGYAMVFINQQVDKVIVSGMTAGTVSAMGYAAVLSNLVTTLIASLCTVLFTNITELNSKKDYVGVIHMAEKSSLLMTVVLLPITIVTCFASKEIVKIAFGRGAFDQRAVNWASYALIGYGIGFIAYAIKSLYARVLYSNKDTRSPMINSTIGIVVNIILSIIFSRFAGVLGVTLASSISEFLAAGLNIRSVKKAFPSGTSIIRLKDVTLILGGTVICLGLMVCIYKYVSVQNRILRFGVFTVVGLSSFYACSLPVIKRVAKLSVNSISNVENDLGV